MGMDIELILNRADPNVVVFLLTILAAFISWLIKGLVEKPLSESKKTFNNLFEKRIEVLTEVKTRLNFILYFPVGKENIEYKKQLQEIFLKDGKTVYLGKDIFQSVMKIAIDPTTDEKLLLKTIRRIDEELNSQISKIQDEISFYKKFLNYSPLKRFVGLTLLSLQYIFAFFLITLVLFSLIWLFLSKYVMLKILAVIIATLGIIFINRWLKK